jgi:hypothetical protein
MLFTVTVDMADSGYFEFSTKSLFKLAEVAQMIGGMQDDESFVNVPDELEKFFDESEEYSYDEDAECYCWYDEANDAWYWLNEESGEWLLVEEEESEEEAEEE